MKVLAWVWEDAEPHMWHERYVPLEDPEEWVLSPGSSASHRPVDICADIACLWAVRQGHDGSPDDPVVNVRLKDSGTQRFRMRRFYAAFLAEEGVLP